MDSGNPCKIKRSEVFNMNLELQQHEICRLQQHETLLAFRKSFARPGISVNVSYPAWDMI